MQLHSSDKPEWMPKLGRGRKGAKVVVDGVGSVDIRAIWARIWVRANQGPCDGKCTQATKRKREKAGGGGSERTLRERAAGTKGMMPL